MKKKKLKYRRYNKNKLFVFVDLVDSEKIDQLSLNELKEMRKNLTAYAARLHPGKKLVIIYASFQHRFSISF